MIGTRTSSMTGDSSTDGTTAPAFDGFEMRLGDVMRGERATMGKSLLDVQRELRIRASYIAAIENCDVSAFDAASFIPGYVRSYARYLGMDQDWVLRRFCEESGFQPAHGLAPPAAGPQPSRRPADPAEALANPRALYLPQPESFWSSLEPRAVGSMLVMAAVALGLGYGGWAVLKEVQKVNLTPSDQPPAVVATLDPVQDAGPAGGAEDLAAVDLPQPEALDRIYRPRALEVPVLTPRDTPIAAIDPGLPEEPAAQTQVAAAEAAQPAGVIQQAIPPDGQAVAAPAVQALGLEAPRMEILATRPAWVRVSSADGAVILEKTLDAGERFALPASEQPPLLRTGNSGAIYFAVNGQTYGPAAPGAKIVKDVELSPDAVTRNYALADVTADPELASIFALASAAPLQGEPTGPATP